MQPRTVASTLAVFIWFCAPAPARAIEIAAPCERPSVFADAAVNVVVLPYSQPASLGAQDTRVGEQLGALVQLESLLAIAKFGRVGLTQLVGDPGKDCTPAIVLDKLLGRVPGASERAKPGGGLILIWGRIFQVDESLFLQSYVRFLRVGVEESVSIPLGERTVGGQLAAQSFACAPRKIAVKDLDAIQRQFASARLLHEEPDAASAVVRIPVDEPLAFWVTDISGDWVRLQPMRKRGPTMQPLPPGWLPARATEAQWSLRQQMPELAAVEGIAGYLAARTQPAAAEAATWRGLAGDAIRQYLANVGANAVLASGSDTGGTPMAVAVPEQLLGFFALQAGEASDASFAEAGEQFDRAAALVPYSTNAANLVTVVRLARAYRHSPTARLDQAIGEWRALLGTDPGNAALLSNLQTAYDVALAAPDSLAAPDRDRLRRERDSLRQVQPQ